MGLQNYYSDIVSSGNTCQRHTCSTVIYANLFLINEYRNSIPTIRPHVQRNCHEVGPTVDTLPKLLQSRLFHKKISKCVIFTVMKNEEYLTFLLLIAGQLFLAEREFRIANTRGCRKIIIKRNFYWSILDVVKLNSFPDSTGSLHPRPAPQFQ
jgi:hypothetical protein